MVLERAGQLVDNGRLPPGALAEAIDMGVASHATRGDAEPPDRASLIAVCRANGFEAARIAMELGVGRSTLYVRLSALGLSLRELR